MRPFHGFLAGVATGAVLVAAILGAIPGDNADAEKMAATAYGRLHAAMHRVDQAIREGNADSVANAAPDIRRALAELDAADRRAVAYGARVSELKHVANTFLEHIREGEVHAYAQDARRLHDRMEEAIATRPGPTLSGIGH